MATIRHSVTATHGEHPTDPTILGQAAWNADHTITGLPTVSVDNTVPRFDGVTGDMQTSGVTIDDSNTLTTGGSIVCGSGSGFATSGGVVQISPNGWYFLSDTASLGFGASNDTILTRDAAGVLAQRNGVNAQEFRLYNTYTDASNYERGFFQWSGNTLYFGTQSAGTGTARSLNLYAFGNIDVSPNATLAWRFNTSGHFLATTDNVSDIGASGANRPRNVYVAGTITAANVVTTNAVVASAAGATLAATDSGSIFTNEGAGSLAVFTLPTAAAGMTFTFIVQDADGIKVNANTGDTLRIATSASAAAGNIQSTTIGSTVVLVSINATEWMATSALGTWSVT